MLILTYINVVINLRRVLEGVRVAPSRSLTYCGGPVPNPEESEFKPLTAEELKELPRGAGVALAARCAMRVEPGFQPAPNRSLARSDFLGLDICITIAVLSAAQGTPSDGRVARSASVAATSAFKGFTDASTAPEYHVALCASFAALAFFRNPAPLIKDPVVSAYEAYVHAAALLEISSQVAATEARKDFQVLRDLALGPRGTDGR